MCWSSSRRPSTAPGSGHKADSRRGVPRRHGSPRPERALRRCPLGASAAPGAPAALLAPRRHVGRATAVWRCPLESTARAQGWARPLTACPCRGVCSPRARSFGAAGVARHKRTTACAHAPGREAWPSCVPAVPERWPAESCAPVTRRQDDPHAGTRGQRRRSWRSSRRTRLRSAPRPGTGRRRERVGASCGGAVLTTVRALGRRRRSSWASRARATARLGGTAGAGQRAATPGRGAL
jgi:hypothetical protein